MKTHFLPLRFTIFIWIFKFSSSTVTLERIEDTTESQNPQCKSPKYWGIQSTITDKKKQFRFLPISECKMKS